MSRPTAPNFPADQAADIQRRWDAAVAADPHNYWLARMNRQRLEGEAVRDAMLAAADTLSQRRGGPGIMAPLPSELADVLLPGQWKASENQEEIHRRSVYLFVRRNLRYPLFEVLDRPDTNASCPQRNVSTTAPQALAMLNSELSLATARELAAYVLRHAPSDPAAQVSLIYQRTLCRPPTDRELAAATSVLQRRSSAALPDIESPDALTDLCLAMFNLNEFIYVD